MLEKRIFKYSIWWHVSRYLKHKNIAQKLGVDLYTDNNFGRVKLRMIFVVTKLALAYYCLLPLFTM